MKKIAIDAMGGDYAPQSVVEGVNRALNDFSDIEVILYGDEAKIKQYLKASERVRIVHTDEKINSDDEPTKAIRKKKNASMVLAAKAVKDGEADAVLSAGNHPTAARHFFLPMLFSGSLQAASVPLSFSAIPACGGQCPSEG